MRRSVAIGIVVGLILVFVAPPATVAAAIYKDYYVIADSPVSEIVEGKDVTFDWHLIPGVTQTMIVLYTSAGMRIVPTSATQYTWTDFPYGYGWWWVKVFIKKGVIILYGETSLKLFHHQFPDDWTGVNYSPGRYDKHERIVFFELQRDYTIHLPSYFLVPEKLPDCCEDEAAFYHQYTAHLSDLPYVWDFIRLDYGGYLTIKQGYRWDGASYPCKNLGSSSCIDATFNIRSSLVHDALYDLMRMWYLVPNRLDQGSEGKQNRKMADMILYMIAMEEGQPKKNFKAEWPLRDNGADSDYFDMRVWGAGATHDDKRLAGWKYHVYELTASASDGKVKLKWMPADYEKEDPNYNEHFKTHNGYIIQRDGKTIATVRPSVTSYIDDNVTDGNAYTYHIRPHQANTNQDDWSNTVQVTVRNVAPTVGAGPDATINEGDTFTSSGSFTDPGADTWTATVDYGDGSGVQSLSLTDKTFSLSHVYADNGVYTVNVTVTDNDGGVGTDTAQVTVNNVAPTVDAGTDATINEGDTFTSSGSFTDPGADTWTATVDYGDGSGVKPLIINPDKTFALNHTYADNGAYTVTVIVSAGDGDEGSDASLVTVENIAPVVNAGADTSFSSGQTFNISAGFNDPGVNDNSWTFMIDWGDDSPITTSSSDFQGANTVTGDHQYFTPGTYTVIVSITDKDGGIGTDTLQVEVASTLLPRFTVTDLTINPEITEVGDSIDITVIVANTGNLTGSHEVSLMMDDVLEQVQEVTLDSGESEPVNFTITPDDIGEHTINVNGLIGICNVKKPKAPAAFSTSDLTISPIELLIGERVTISLILTNTGERSGAHDANLKIDGVQIETKRITLDTGESQKVVFAISPDTMGTHIVDIDGLSGSFVVKEMAPTPTEEEKVTAPAPEQVPKPTINWLTIIGIVVGITIVSLASYYFIRKKRKTI